MLKRAFYCALISLFVFSCSTEETGKTSVKSKTLPASNGGILDIIVIAPENYWLASSGRAFQKYFTDAQYGLPQPEPKFTVRQVSPKSYNKLLKRSRYQIVFSQAEETGFTYVEEEYAKDQLIIYLSAPTNELMTELIKSKHSEIQEKIKSMERARLLQKLKPALRKSASSVYKKHHTELLLPLDYELDVEEENTLVYWKKTNTSDYGLIVNFRPYPHNQSIMGQDIIPIRDSLTQKHIMGSREGSYMITETLIQPQITSIDLADNFTLEARGFWRTEGDLMGGPFISYTIYDEDNNQVIYLDAFIYGPDRKKRNDLLEMEALLRSIKVD